MTADEAWRAVAVQLIHVSERELHWLRLSDTKLFAEGPAAQWMRPLDDKPDLAESIDAYCARFARLQDTLGDKMLPRALQALRETTAGFLDNLAAAERAGLVSSAAEFVAARDLRNRFAHDYSSRIATLALLLDAAHELVPFLAHAQDRLAAALRA